MIAPSHPQRFDYWLNEITTLSLQLNATQATASGTWKATASTVYQTSAEADNEQIQLADGSFISPYAGYKAKPKLGTFMCLVHIQPNNDGSFPLKTILHTAAELFFGVVGRRGVFYARTEIYGDVDVYSCQAQLNKVQIVNLAPNEFPSSFMQLQLTFQQYTEWGDL